MRIPQNYAWMIEEDVQVTFINSSDQGHEVTILVTRQDLSYRSTDEPATMAAVVTFLATGTITFNGVPVQLPADDEYAVCSLANAAWEAAPTPDGPAPGDHVLAVACVVEP
jgi:hypothetical protein